MRPLACTLALAFAASALAADNLYPDPSFERTGVPGTARTGKRAGHLKVGTQIHWTAIGGAFPVEPFATYRATAYVRARKGKGTLFGLYVYSWNSFDWSWATSVPLGNIAEWQRIEVTFLSPSREVFLHPLATVDVENGEAWIDDLTVEQVRSPEETLKALLAKPPASKEDIQLLARHFVAQGQPEKARALAEKAEDYTRADVACLLAQHAKDPRERLRLAVEMVRYGGLGYHNGHTRFRELTAGASAAMQAQAFADAAVATKGEPRAMRALVDSIASQIDEAASEGSCRQCEQQLDRIQGQAAAIAGKIPKDAPGRKELDKVNAKLAAARADVAKRRGQLGSCVIRIGGHPLDPATHAIVVPDKPTPQEKFAASDLNAHIERLTGRDLPVVPDGKLASQIPIAVGRCAATHKKLGLAIDLEGLGIEGIDIRTKGPALVLAGNRRGVLYAVYTFLESHCGCRWFTPECSHIPTTGTFDIPWIRHRHIPPLEYRSTDYPCSRDAAWAVRNKINGTQTRLNKTRGGKIAYSHFVHTFNAILNPDQHFAQHPEYFSMIKGKRMGGRTQLCLTNPEVLEIAKKTVRRWIAEAPDATIFSVSQNDWRNPCECPKCAALDKKEGTHAGTLIHFVNAIARDIAKDHPDKLISTLAYQYTRTPPKTVRPEPNVCVRLCTIECDFAHPLDTSTHPQNIKFVDDIRGWNKLCDRLYIWDYIIDYRHSVMPWPNLYALKPNIRFFIDNGVKGLYEEACYFTKGSELAELRTWIIAKTMWDPDYDTDHAIDEFLAGYYGPAAAPIRRYIDLMHKPVMENDDMYIYIWTHFNAPYLSTENVEESVRLFDEAEKAVAKDPVLLHRVQVARLPILYVQISTAQPAYREEGNALVASGQGDLAALVDKFGTVARKEGLTMIREHGGSGRLGTWLKSLNVTGKEMPIVRLANDALELSILPAVGGRIWKMVHKPSGREIIKRLTHRDGGEMPDAAGYEEYSEGEYRSPGWNERYRVVKKSKAAVTLEAQLRNQLKITRTITLDAKAPKVTIESTLTNTGKGPKPACLRAHPGYAVSDVKQAVVRILGAQGKWKTRKLGADKQDETDEWLQGTDLPHGEWIVVDAAAKLGIRSTFDPKQIGRCLLNRCHPEGRVNLELYSKPATLAPGKTLSLTHTIEVVPAPAGKASK